MRKDVRLGLAVGGILFGVVLVYVLFFAGGGKGEDQYAVGDTSSESTENSTSAGGSEAGAARPYDTGSTIVETGPIAGTVTPQGPVGGNTGNAGARNHQSAQQGHAAPVHGGINPTTRPVGQIAGGFGTPTAAATGTSFNWRQLMEEGDLSGQLLSRTVTPTPGGGREEHRIIMDGRSSSSSNGTALEARAGESGGASVGQRSYLVKSGDSFWSIAKAEYGNASYYAHLVRANPKVDPAKLKAGMRITIPGRDEVIPTNAPATALAPTPVAIDETRQYRVKKGDSLSVIAQRLYGRAAMADKIYQLNQDVIGPNPSALKLNAILTLPETPTRVAAN